jgi:hypothetical protein
LALTGPVVVRSTRRRRALLLASLAQVGPLYALGKEGGFKLGDERGIAFATKRLAAG